MFLLFLKQQLNLLVQRILLADLGDFAADVIFLVVEVLDGQIDALCDLQHILFHQAASRHGRGADADAGGDERAAGLAGHGVLVDRDVDFIQTVLQHLAGDLQPDQIQQHQMVVGAAGDDLLAALHQGVCQSLCIQYYLMLISLEFGL